MSMERPRRSPGVPEVHPPWGYCPLYTNPTFSTMLYERAWFTIRFETEEEKEIKRALWLSEQKEHAAKELRRLQASMVPPTMEIREA